MKNKPWIRILEACAFLLVLCAAVNVVSRVTERKESRALFGAFLEEPQAYDVLFVGDSCFINGMLPLEIWKDYGIAGYNLSCYGNTIPTSYWSIMNALDYAKPKLVVMATNGVREERKVTGNSSDLHTALDFWPMSRTKMQAIEDLTLDEENPENKDDDGNNYQDIKWEFYAKLGKYHGRWSELTKADFSPVPAKGKGGEILVGIHPYWEYDIIDEDQYAEEFGYGYAYLRKSIEACRLRGIDVLLVNLPHPGSINSQKSANTVSSIAAEYGVDYLDLARMDSIVDYAVDCYDEQPHLNAAGTQKVTAYLGSYIQMHFDLPDRRDDARYAHWNEQYEAFVGNKIELLRREKALHHALILLYDKDFDVRIAVREDSPLYYDDLGILLMHNMAREPVLAGEEYEKWSNAMYPLTGFDDAIWENQPYFLLREDGAVRECMGAQAERAMRDVFGDERSTVMIEAIDRRTGTVAAKLHF